MSCVVNSAAVHAAAAAAMQHNPYAASNQNVANHVMGASAAVPDVHKRDKDAIYGWVNQLIIFYVFYIHIWKNIISARVHFWPNPRANVNKRE